MNKLRNVIAGILILIPILTSAQWIDASNTTVVGLTEKNTDSIMSLDGEGKMGYILKDSLGGSFETAANGGIFKAGRNEDDYGDIGNYAFDASFSGGNSSIRGATGNYSTAFGANTTASGLSSAAFGASTEATGFCSTAFGENTVALNTFSAAFGAYNDMSSTPNARFQIGNGNSFNRKNAYTLNNDATSYQDNIAFYNDDYSANYTDRSLVDKGYVDSEIAGLGTMSAEDAADYYTKTQVNDTLSNYPLYDEGTWSGDFVTSGTETIPTGTQNYIKVGNQVTIYVDWSGDLSGLTGIISIDNLPAFGGTIPSGSSAIVVHRDGITYPTDATSLIVRTNAGHALFRFNIDGSDYINLSDANITGTTHSFSFTLTYRITP